MPETRPAPALPPGRVLLYAALALLPVLVALLLWFGRGAFFLLFSGILFAAVLDAAVRVAIRAGLGRGPALGLVLVILGALMAAGIWYGGRSAVEQSGALYDALDAQADQVAELVVALRGGEAAADMPDDPKPLGTMRRLWGMWFGEEAGPAGLVAGTFGALANVAIIFFVGAFLAASPQTYKRGTVRLFPPRLRGDADDALSRGGETLRRWLTGKLISMTLIAVLTGIGLLALGFPLALPLAVLAGLLAFVPNLGPILFYVPLALVGLTAGTSTLLLGLAVYAGVQAVESYVFTPMVQERMVSLPPALILFAQVLGGVIFGPWGIALATPLAAVLKTWVDEFYVRRGLEGRAAGEDVSAASGA